MAEAIALQQTLFYTVTRALANFKKIGKGNYTKAKIQQRMKLLKETWTEWRKTHVAILRAYPGDQRGKIMYFQEDQFDKHEDVYHTAMDYMAECLEEVDPTVSQNQSLNSTTTHADYSNSMSLRHLPAIQLPPFSGKFEEWASFRDRFTSLIIKNKELSDFSRMHFLTSCVTGRAKDAIESLAVTAENFEIAWKALNTRFENKRRLIEVQISTLHTLRDKVDKVLASLKQMNRSSDEIVNDIIVYCISQKFDPATRRAWKLTFSDESPPATYTVISSFISSRAGALEELNPAKTPKSSQESKVMSATVSTAQEPVCLLCQKRHFINRCNLFIDKSPSQRREIVKQHKRCFNCLSTRHSLSDCNSKFACRYCQKKHHSMLHLDSNSSSNATSAAAPTAANEQPPKDAQANSLSAISTTSTPSPVLLATARVVVRSPSGRSQTVRALLDQGSEVSFITENLAQALRLRRIHSRTTISAVGCVKVGTCKHAAQIEISSRYNKAIKFESLAYIIASLTKYSPRCVQVDKAWRHLEDINLADDNPTRSDQIDILIGADLYSRVIFDGVRKGAVGQPIAQNSQLGWIISGPTSTQSVGPHSVQIMHCTLEQKLRRFWEVEELPPDNALSRDEKLCEEHFLATHSRDSTGRYTVRLPFNEGPPIKIGESRQTASRMLAALNRRLNRNPDLKAEYAAFLATYESLDHMVKVSEPVDAVGLSQVVYIPHHAVVRESSSTTRLDQE